MYKILIVDDEAVVREGIRDNMNWKELGYEFVGACENGSEAIEAVNRLRPDVVLTDIYMPFVDGLELTKYILDKFPFTKVIILTGYDEFEYAQQAVKLRAYDFILKPVTASELRNMLKKLKEELDEEKRKMEDISKLKMQVRESLPLLRERFLNRLVSGHISENRVEEKLSYFNLHFNGDNFLIAVVDVDDYGELNKYHPGTEDELLLFAVFNICEEIVAKYNAGLVFQNAGEKTIIIFTGDDSELLREKAMSICEEVRQAVEKYLLFTVTIGVGAVCSGLKNVNISYKGGLSALDYRFLLGKNRVIHISDIEGDTNDRPSYNREWDKKLVLTIKTGTRNEIDEIIDRILQSLKDSYVSIDRCYIHIQHLIVSIIDSLNEMGISETELYKDGVSPLTEIYKMRTLADVENWLKEFCNKASTLITNKRDSFSKVQAMKAQDYIKENFADENISLSSVCKHLSMSISYFSTIFKNTTGETFIEYLTRIRIEKAMELLKGTELKSYEIALRVGYRDPHYFGVIFKKATGLTPTEFRERMQ